MFFLPLFLMKYIWPVNSYGCIRGSVYNKLLIVSNVLKQSVRALAKRIKKTLYKMCAHFAHMCNYAQQHIERARCPKPHQCHSVEDSTRVLAGKSEILMEAKANNIIYLEIASCPAQVCTCVCIKIACVHAACTPAATPQPLRTPCACVCPT